MGGSLMNRGDMWTGELRVFPNTTSALDDRDNKYELQDHNLKV